MIKSDSRYPLPPLSVARFCDGNNHITLSTDRLGKPILGSPNDMVEACDGECKGWFKVKRKAEK